MVENVAFYSEGNLLKGNLYLPPNWDESGLYPAIILCHGFAGVKELLLPNFASKFSENGYIVLTFDYSGFGKSEGEPGKLSPFTQIADIRNAISFLLSNPSVNPERIGLWGTSYGGANSIVVTALDRRIKCLVVQLTFGDGERVITQGLTPEEKAKLFDSLNKTWIRKVTKNKDLQLPLDKILTDEQSIEFYNQNVGEFPALKSKLSFLTIKETMSHKPEIYLQQVQVPILIIAAENDLVNPKEESNILFEKAREPKELYLVKNATHYEVYAGEKFEEVVSKELAWFNKYLGCICKFCID